MGTRSVEVSGHRNILLEVDGVRKYMKEKGVPKEEARDRRTRIIKTRFAETKHGKGRIRMEWNVAIDEKKEVKCKTNGDA